MKIRVVKENDVDIAIVDSDELLITDAGSALDFFATVDYQTGCSRMAIHKSAVCEAFFDLSTGIAGDILQKFINYRKKIAVIGDFSQYASKSLKAFIHECNQGRDIFFVPDEKEAVEKLSMNPRRR
ncbi:MAG: DUF4180 domain-containing protein [Clostridiales bacterium]|nr:DUF4180 domain-containing protein [Clostridiales bacterium]